MKTVTIAGKKYLVETKNGIRYINGMTVDNFINTLSIDDKCDAALVGIEYIKSRGTKSPQKMFNELHQSKNN